MALVCLGKHRGANHADIAAALRHLKPGGILLVDGPKTHGADSVLKLARTHLEVAGVISKAHGKVFWLERPKELPPQIKTWAQNAASQPNRDGFIAAPGMFSHEAIDPGTAFLAEHLDPKLKGRAADLGAGWGALTALLLQACPDITELDLYEADRKALTAAEANITDARARFHWADVTALPADTYDVIVANPPFHTARKAEPELGIAFIKAAARMLAPKGTFMMVANRHLPYETALNQSFKNWSETATSAQFKVIKAKNPQPER